MSFWALVGIDADECVASLSVVDSGRTTAVNVARTLDTGGHPLRHEAWEFTEHGRWPGLPVLKQRVGPDGKVRWRR
jgi:hypothetical protein